MISFSIHSLAMFVKIKEIEEDAPWALIDSRIYEAYERGIQLDIGIIGAGAIGLLFASHLSGNHAVTVYTKSEEQAAVLVSEGLFLKEGKSRLCCAVSAVPVLRMGHLRHDLLIVAVKQYDLEAVVPAIQSSSIPVLFLQNGMGHTELMEFLSVSRPVYAGVVEHGAMRLSANEVAHTGLGRTRVAPYSGNIAVLDPLDTPSFPFVFSHDPKEILTRKLFVNAMINPLTAVLGVPNGSLVSNPYYHSIFDALFKELCDVIVMNGREELKAHVEDICRSTAKNRSSMLSDIEAGRATEIDSILGYVLKAAVEQSLAVPVTETLYRMIKGKEMGD
ncbi:MAG: 2-dehydropantoate 2-reductase [Bacillus sp. (in: firmicutes)]